MESKQQGVCCVCFHTFRNLYPLGILRAVLFSLVGRRSTYCKELQSVNLWLCWECRSILNKLYKFKKVAVQSQEYMRDLKLLKISKLPNLTVHTNQWEFDGFTEIMIEKYDKDDVDDYESHTKSVIKHERFECSLHDENNTSLPLFVKENEVEISQFTPKIDANVGEFGMTNESAENTFLVPPITYDSNKERSDLFPEKHRYMKIKNMYDIIILDEQEMQQDRTEKYENLKFDPFACEKCFVIFKTIGQLKEHHEKAHTRKSDSDFHCEICNTYVSNKKIPIATHKRIHYVRYKCKICSAEFETANQIGSHMSEHKERGCKKFRCKGCNNSYDEEKCEKHPFAKIVENFQCDHCKKYFKFKYALYIHMRSHGHVAAVKCNVCAKSFQDPHYLKLHIRYKHEDKSVGQFYYCTDCKMEFKSDHSLRLHLKYNRKHMKSDAFHVCEYCNKKFCTNKSYIYHKKMYHSNNPIVCDLCGKKLISEVVLRKHKLAIHEKVVKKKERNHICDQCGKGFPERKTMLDHVRIHSDLRPFACSLCSSTFKFSGALYTHLKLVHKKKKLQKVRSEKEVVGSV